ncbi:Guanylate kinase like protein [Verticillium longisporum]|nr:Guanylate kinase like protein [Verticillium longisporum]
MRAGQPIVISGPSGVGKGALIKKLQDTHRGLFTLTVSHTTRSPRPGEVDGVDYYFVSDPQFTALVTQNKFIEHTTFSGSMHGTSRRAIIDQVAKSLVQGTIVLLDIDLEGVKQLKGSPEIPVARYVFVKPPSLDELEGRLRSRGTEMEKDLQRRMARAKTELEYADATPGLHDLTIVNDDMERAYRELEEFIFR